MRWARRWLPAGLVAVLLVGAAPRPAHGALPIVQQQLSAPLVRARLVVGTTATVRWERLPAEIDEFELLLSLDGGASYSVRLTPELDPATRRLAWQIPNLPVRDARLRLRAGVGGEEIESPPSARFEIVGAPTTVAASLRYSAGEWWTTGPAGPRSPESVSRESRLRRRGTGRLEPFPALPPDDSHELTFDPASLPVALPVAALEQQAPAAWSDPSRPVAPNQRE